MIKIYRINYDTLEKEYLGGIEGGSIVEQVNNELEILFGDDVPTDIEAKRSLGRSKSFQIEDTENRDFASSIIADLGSNGDKL